jgi:hypothetical protein
LDRARTLNERFEEPMPDGEVATIARSIWKYTSKGRNRFGQHGSWLPLADVDALIAEPFTLELLNWLQARNGRQRCRRGLMWFSTASVTSSRTPSRCNPVATPRMTWRESARRIQTQRRENQSRPLRCRAVPAQAITVADAIRPKPWAEMREGSGRNNEQFRQLGREAHYCDDFDQLLGPSQS